MNRLTTQSGKLITLGKLIGQGGEGSVYLSSTDSAFAVKIYHPEKAANKEAKIKAITATKLPYARRFGAFPLEAVRDGNSNFVGFTMEFAPQRKPIHEAYSPSSRKQEFPNAGFPFLLRIAANIARAVAAIHADGCVIGDINHSGILVAADATIRLIDTDSFQYALNGTVFPCEVGVQEFTPPELQNSSSTKVVRTKNHDCFGLAIVIFYLMFMGKHPFAGQPIGWNGPESLGDAIADYRFAYSARRQETRMAPPPHGPTLKDVPLQISDAFEIAFGQVGASQGRPNAQDWVRIIESYEKSVVTCSNYNSHQYFSQAKHCPWCRMERAFPGFTAFKPVIEPRNHVQEVSLDVILKQFKSLPGLPSVPAIEGLLPLFSRSTPQQSTSATDERSRREFGLLEAAMGSVMLVGPNIVAIIGFGIVCFGAFFYFKKSEYVEKLDDAFEQAKAKWQKEKLSWEARCSDSAYVTLTQQGDRIATEARAFNDAERSKIAALQTKLVETQLRAFLNGFRIDRANIKNIGPSRIITLLAYNIETAADIELNRVRFIKGFGPARAEALVKWRKSIESRFVFNPNASVNQADVDRVRNEFNNKRLQSSGRLAAIIAALSKERDEIIRRRTSLDNYVKDAWSSLNSAKAELETARNNSKPPQKAHFAAACLIPLMLSALTFAPSWTVSRTNFPERGFPANMPATVPATQQREPPSIQETNTPIDTAEPTASPPLKAEKIEVGSSAVAKTEIPSAPPLAPPLSVSLVVAPPISVDQFSELNINWNPNREATCSIKLPSGIVATRRKGRSIGLMAIEAGSKLLSVDCDSNGQHAWDSASVYVKEASRELADVPIDSAWRLNESTVVKGLKNNLVTFFYAKPRTGLRNAGVVAGTLLAYGNQNGSKFTGTAFMFSKRCGALPYAVSGSITVNSISLYGLSPRVDGITCRAAAPEGRTIEMKLLK